MVAEVLDRFPDRVEGLADRLQGARPARVRRPARPGSAWPTRCSGTSTPPGRRSPLLLVRVPEIPEWSADAPWPEGCTLFVPFQDPENVGAVIRSAAAFGVARVVLLREAAHPFHPKAARAAGTALFQVAAGTGPVDPGPPSRPRSP